MTDKEALEKFAKLYHCMNIEDLTNYESIMCKTLCGMGYLELVDFSTDPEYSWKEYKVKK